MTSYVPYETEVIQVVAIAQTGSLAALRCDVYISPLYFVFRGMVMTDGDEIDQLLLRTWKSVVLPLLDSPCSFGFLSFPCHLL